MKNILDERKSNWKQDFLENIRKSKTEDDAVKRILSNHLIFSRGFRQVRTRLFKIISNLQNQISSVKNSRIDIKEKRNLEKIYNDLKEIKSKIR